jgi:hypothetical protein
VKIAFHFATLFLLLQPRELVMAQQTSTGMYVYGHSLKECCTKAAESSDI